MPKIQQVSGHKSSHLGIILINGIYCRNFFFVANDHQWNISCHFFHLSQIVWMRITGINDSLGCHGSDHPQILFLQFRISLGITDKHTIAPLICHSFNSLKQQYIIRTCDGRTKNNDQFFFFTFFFVLMTRQGVAKVTRSFFHFFHGFPGKRDIVFMIQHHRYRCLGNACFPCHIRGCRLFTCQGTHLQSQIFFTTPLCLPAREAVLPHQCTPGHRLPELHWQYDSP